jgi:hypothetical protein
VVMSPGRSPGRVQLLRLPPTAKWDLGRGLLGIHLPMGHSLNSESMAT